MNMSYCSANRAITSMVATTLMVLVLSAPALLLTSPALRAENVLKGTDALGDKVTPDFVLALLQKYAVASEERAPGKKGAHIGMWEAKYADDAAEFDALAQNGIMLVTVISRKKEDLPLKRMYVVSPTGEQTTLRQLYNWDSTVDAKTLAYKIFGKFREDAFYLVPVASLLREGEVRGDFAAKNVSITFGQLPIPNKFDYHVADPKAGAAPEKMGVHDFIVRKFPGFPPPIL
jgi:hypothetical protein